MNSQILIGDLKLKTWFILFTIIQSVLLILIISSLLAPNWVSTDFDLTINYISSNSSNLNTFTASSFSGGISNCFRGCDSDYKYTTLRHDICTYKNDLKSEKYSNPLPSNLSNLESICDMFTSLSKAMIIKIAFDIIAIISFVFWCVSMICIPHKFMCFWVSALFSSFGCIFFYIGTFLWFFIANARFGSCGKKPSDGDGPRVCAEDGQKIALFLILMLPFILGFYYIVICKVYYLRLDNQRNSVNNFQPENRKVFPKNTQEFNNRNKDQLNSNSLGTKLNINRFPKYQPLCVVV